MSDDMTPEEAQAEARRRWGERAYVSDSRNIGVAETGKVRHFHFRVQMKPVLEPTGGKP